MHDYPGLFIAVESLDGGGASTQAGLLRKALQREGLKVYITKEPTNNIIGGLIRGALSGVHQLPPEALQLLFVADRSHHLQREIIPILNEEGVVISDRFLWSTVAFGSINLSRHWLLRLHHYCPLPDLSIFLRVSPRVCLERLKADRYDFELFEEENKLWRAWDTYEWLAKKFPKEIVIVNGEKKPRLVLKEILGYIKKQPKYKNKKR